MTKILVVAAPKKFEGHIRITQDNAIKSWSVLFGAENICLFGDEETGENAIRLGTKYAKPDYSDTNVPLLDSMLKTARLFGADYILFINADIILMDDFKKAFLTLNKTAKKPFMMIGHRTNLDFKEPINFDSNWQEYLRSFAKKDGELAGDALIDYFLFPSKRFIEIPALRIGRPGIDNILLYWTRKKEKMDLIDVTPDVLVVHQNHDYSYFPGGKPAIYSGKDKDINFALGGNSYRYYFFISESNKILKKGIIKRKVDLSYYFSRRYVFDILPALHPIAHKLLLPIEMALRLMKRGICYFRRKIKLICKK